MLGVGEAIYLPGGSKIVSLLFPPAQRALPNGLFDAGTRTGLVMEGVLVPWMLTHYGWRATFSVVGFAALLWLVPWFLVTPRNLRAPRPAVAPAPVSIGRRLHALLTNRNLIGICLGVLLLRLLLVFPGQLAAGLPRHVARVDDDARRDLRGAAVHRVRPERADRRLDRRPPHRGRHGRDARRGRRSSPSRS